MLLVGLTGGIASGKSTVAAMLADRGAIILDADRIARDIVEPGQEPYRKIVEHFGSEILKADLRIDRERLGRIVFADPVKRALLNELTHPTIMGIIADRLEQLRPTESIVVCDIPLLVEAGVGASSFDLIIVVNAGRDTQIQRLTRDRRMSNDDALARIGSQATTDERRALADIVIDNDAEKEELARQVDLAWQRITDALAASARS